MYAKYYSNLAKGFGEKYFKDFCYGCHDNWSSWWNSLKVSNLHQAFKSNTLRKFGDNPEHGLGGKDFSKNPYIVLYKTTGHGPGCGPLWAQGLKFEGDIETFWDDAMYQVLGL